MGTESRDENAAAQDWRSTVDQPDEPDPLAAAKTRAAEPGRGREATSPAEIPPRGWRDILLRVFWCIPEDRILSTAGSVAFFALLAVFPGLATVVSLYGLFADPGRIGAQLALLEGILPDGVLDLVGAEMARVASQRSGALGAAFLAGSAVALWCANSGVAALFDALNVVYKEREKRSLLRFYATTFLFTLGGIGFALATIAAVVVLPLALGLFGLATFTERLLAVARWPVLLLAVAAGLALVYRHGPSRRPAKWRWVSWGSAGAAVLWIAMSMLFSTYVASFDSYNRTYGSLGAGVGFMTWIWLSVVVVLLGAELDAEMERQTAMDTTSGRPKPLGARGAVVADTVGEAQ